MGESDEKQESTAGRGDHPMAHTDADKVSTATTDRREEARDPHRHMGKHWTGETAPDVEFRENAPLRGGEQGQEANDAF